MFEKNETQSDFLGRGWSFPPSFNIHKQAVDMDEKKDDIESSLRILLTTSVGERVMLPGYGCNLEELLFDNLNTTTKAIVKDKIRTSVLYFEPRINVVNIEINSQNEIEGELLIEIEYEIRSTNSRYNFVFPFYKNEGTEIGFMTGNKQGI